MVDSDQASAVPMDAPSSLNKELPSSLMEVDMEETASPTKDDMYPSLAGSVGDSQASQFDSEQASPMGT